MFFFPYRPDVPLFRVPWLTLVICVACAGVYLAQWLGDARADEAAKAFCERPGNARYEQLVQHVFGEHDVVTCVALMERIRQADDPRRFIETRLVRDIRPAGQSEVRGQAMLVRAVMDRYVAYEAVVPATVTASFLYHPGSLDPARMLLATVAHGSWQHLVSNLFFFFAFASAVEMLASRLKFAVLLLVLAVGPFATYSLSFANPAEANPTLGLSGVVYGVMALLAWLAPRLGIRWFVFFFGLMGRFVIPVWLMAVWLIGLDTLRLAFADETGGVNLTAHVSGALFGIIAGAIAFTGERARLRRWAGVARIQPEPPGPHGD